MCRRSWLLNLRQQAEQLPREVNCLFFLAQANKGMFAGDKFPSKPTLLLAQWSIAVVYLVNARLGFAMAVAVVMA